MSETTLLSLLKHDPSFSHSNPVSLKYPQVHNMYILALALALALLSRFAQYFDPVK